MYRSLFSGLVFVFFLNAPSQLAAQFLPPGALNPAAGIDSGADFFVDHAVDKDGTQHAVWASQHDYDGLSGTDSDIWYSRNDGGGWSSPRLVNSYGHIDSAPFDDREPSLATTDTGVLYCVWSTNLSGFGWGPDYDVLVSIQTTPGGFWSVPLPVNDATTDSADDRYPAIAVPVSGEPVVLWEGEDPGFPHDREILWSYQSALGWSTPTIMSRGNYADWQDHGPISLALTPGRETLIAAWAADDQFDSDVFLSRYLLSDFFPPNWASPVNIGETPQPWPEGDATAPAVALYPGDPLSIHVVFSSVRPNDSDQDVRYRVLLGDIDDPEPRGFTEVNVDADIDSLDDRNPDVCVEPSGSVHVVWQRADPSADDDVYHAASSLPIGTYAAFSPPVTIGGQGDGDDPGEHDLDPDLECFSNNLVSAAWNSLDDLGGVLGSDWDLLHSIGLGRLFTPPETPHPLWQSTDVGGDEDIDPALASHQDGSVLAVWSTLFPFNASGTDRDLVWAQTDGEGRWVSLHSMPGATSDFGEDLDPVLASDAAGPIYCVYATENDPTGSLGPDLDLVYSVFQDGAWSGPLPVGSWGSQDAGSAADYSPAAIVTADGTLIVAWAAPGVGVVSLRKTVSGWSAAELIGSPADYLQADLFSAVSLSLDAAGLPMVGFFALDPVTHQERLFWSRRDSLGWAAPTDIGLADSSSPPLLFLSGAEPTLVWPSLADAGGTGPDADLLTARLGFQGWSAPEALLLSHYFDADADYVPVGVAVDDTLHLTWRSTANLGGTAGSDLDIFYAGIDLTQFAPYTPVIVLANPNGHADNSDSDGGQAIALERRRVVVAWSQFTFIDWDIFTSLLVVPEAPLFADGFETGDTGRWSASGG